MRAIWLILVFSLLLILVWFRNGSLMGGGESGLPFYNLDKIASINRYSWSDLGLGNVTGIGTAAYPTHLTLSKLQALGISSVVVQAIFYFILLAISGISIYLLTKQIFPEIKDKFAFIAVLFYWFNPISLANVWGRNLDNFKMFFAVFPFFWLLYLIGLKKEKFYLAVVFSLSTGVFSYALTSTPFNILLWFTIIFTTVFFFLTSKNHRQRIFYLLYFSMACVGYILVNTWWLGQLFSFLSSTAYVTAVSDFFSSQGNLDTLSTLSERLGNFIDITRFVHGTFYSDGPIWARIYLFPLIFLLGFTPSLIILWAIYRFRKNKEVLFLGSLFIMGLFLTKGVNSPMGEIFRLVFAKFTFLQVFRNPFEKFGFLLSLSASPLLAYGLASFEGRIGVWGKKFHLLFLLYLSIILGFPYWTGLVLTRVDPNDPKKFVSLEVSVPDDYKQANQWLMDQGSDFRFVVLPLNGEGMTYTWDKPYAGVELSSTLFEIPNVSFNSTIPLFSTYVDELYRHQIDEKIFNLLPFINSKFIVLRGQIDYKDRQTANPDISKGKLDEWTTQGLLTRRFQKENLSIYEVNKKYSWPKIYATSKVLNINNSNLAEAIDHIPDFPQNKIAVIGDSETINEVFAPVPLFLKPDDVFIPSYPRGVPNLSNQELLARLFVVKHSPIERYYPLIRIKEALETPPSKERVQRFDYEVGILGKRAVEIYKLYTEGGGIGVAANLELEYISNIQKLSRELGDDLVSEVIRDSLVYQFLLLRKIGSKAADEIFNAMVDVKITPRFPLSSGEDRQYLVYRFTAPETNDYELLFSESRDISALFLDGEGVESLTGFREIKLRLNKGTHEIALFADDLEKDPIISEKDFVMDDERKRSWNLILPNVPTQYRLELDFRFKKGNSFILEFVQDIDKPDKPIFRKEIKKDHLYHDWRHWEGKFSSGAGATIANLKVVTGQENVCEILWYGREICADQDAKYEVEIKNFKLTSIEPSVILRTPEKKLSLNSTTVVEWEKINPTLYRVEVDKASPTPELLVFSELYNSGWEARYGDGEKISEKNHILANLYANGWIIDRQGKHEIYFEFAPERLLQRGRIISLVSSSLGLIYIFGSVLWKKRY